MDHSLIRNIAIGLILLVVALWLVDWNVMIYFHWIKEGTIAVFNFVFGWAYKYV